MRSFASFFVHALIFLASFTLEVTVNAAENQTITQEPANCLNRGSVCAIENSGAPGFEVKIGSSSVLLDRGAAIIRQADDQVRLVHGTIWVKAAKPVHVASEFGDIVSTSEGDFWVSRTKDVITGSAISTLLHLTARGSNETLDVAPGLQNTIGGVAFDGKATTAIPMPVPFKDHLMRWARLHRGPKKQFEDDVEAFHKRWVHASEASAEINQSLYARKVASVEEAKATRAAKAAKIESENRELRDLFRKRSLEGL